MMMEGIQQTQHTDLQIHITRCRTVYHYMSSMYMYAYMSYMYTYMYEYCECARHHHSHESSKNGCC